MAHVGNSFKSEVRVNDRRTETEEQGKVHHFADFTALHNQADFRAHARFYQGAVHASRRQERRNRHVAPVNVLVRKHDDIVLVVHRTHGITREVLQGSFQHFAVSA